MQCSFCFKSFLLVVALMSVPMLATSQDEEWRAQAPELVIKALDDFAAAEKEVTEAEGSWWGYFTNVPKNEARKKLQRAEEDLNRVRAVWQEGKVREEQAQERERERMDRLEESIK